MNLKRLDGKWTKRNTKLMQDDNFFVSNGLQKKGGRKVSFVWYGDIYRDEGLLPTTREYISRHKHLFTAEVSNAALMHERCEEVFISVE